jgi:hypothetical protein
MCSYFPKVIDLVIDSVVQGILRQVRIKNHCSVMKGKTEMVGLKRRVTRANGNGEEVLLGS